MKLPLWVALLGVSLCSAEDPRITTLIQSGDAEARGGHHQAALAYFRSAESIEKSHLPLLLRLAEQSADLVDSTKPPAAAMALARDSLAYAHRALALDSQSPKAHLRVAVAYGKLVDFVGNRTKLEYSKKIRDEVEQTIKLDPNEHLAWYILGRWEAGVADLSGVLRFFAKIVYGGLPTASHQTALQCLQKATALAPHQIIYQAELARLYEKLGDLSSAIVHWKIIATLPSTDATDNAEKVLARKSLAAVRPDASP